MRVRKSSDDVLRQLGCKVTACGLELPRRLSLEGWAAVGRELGKQQHALQWRVGDWWNHPSHAYGERRALVEAEDWTGPAYGTCANAGTTCENFELSRRRESLSFSHHVEVAHLPPNLADKLLDWCEETIATTAKPRSVRALRDEINRRLERMAKPTPTFGTTTPAPTIALTIAPAPPQEDGQLRIATILRHEPEVQEQLGDPLPEDCAARRAMEIVITGIHTALKVTGIPEDLRSRLQQCLRILC